MTALREAGDLAGGRSFASSKNHSVSDKQRSKESFSELAMELVLAKMIIDEIFLQTEVGYRLE